MNFPLLSAIMFLPLIGAVIIAVLPRGNKMGVRWTAVISTGLSLVLSLYMTWAYDTTAGGYQFVEKITWVETLGVQYFLGVDGISVSMVLLTAFVIFTGCLVSWVSIQEREKEFFFFLLTLVFGVHGVFMSLDLLFFYLFYELAVIPMYPLIGIWGSSNKEYATMKLTIYLTLGSLIALVALLAMYFLAGEVNGYLTFDMTVLASTPYGVDFQWYFFPALLFGFSALIPMMPFHSWSPAGHAAAPTAVSMLHAGVLMKLGAYAVIRICLDMFPAGAQAWMPLVAALCVLNMIFGGLVAMSKRDFKFMIGYSSSSHMGYVLLGLACVNIAGINGAVMVMFAHGIMTALAFALIGFIYDRAHTRMIYDFSGLAKHIPFLGVCFAIMAFASAGLPGFANFVGELLVIIAAFKVYPLAAVAAVFGIIISATYMLRAIRDAFFSEPDPKWADLEDAHTFLHRAPYVILISILLIVGFYPFPLLEIINSGVEPLVDKLNHAAEAVKTAQLIK
ncbi:MAG: NADH-quinone oxidoreductase subunit M [Deltaproteobacteria bacterium]|nr:NADH-quinone oxidoreductase subunit M [Deltaproteobacteria bacterium]